MPCFGPLLTKVRRTVSARHIKRAKMQWQNKKTMLEKQENKQRQENCYRNATAKPKPK